MAMRTVAGCAEARGCARPPRLGDVAGPVATDVFPVGKTLRTALRHPSKADPDRCGHGAAQ